MVPRAQQKDGPSPPHRHGRQRQDFGILSKGAENPDSNVEPSDF